MRPFSFEEKPFHIARILFSSFHYHSFSYLLRALLYFDSPKKKRKKDRKRKKKTMERKIFSSYRLRSSLFYTNKPFFLFLSSSIYLYPSLSFSFILSFILSFFLFFSVENYVQQRAALFPYIPVRFLPQRIQFVSKDSLGLLLCFCSSMTIQILLEPIESIFLRR